MMIIIIIMIITIIIIIIIMVYPKYSLVNTVTNGPKKFGRISG